MLVTDHLNDVDNWTRNEIRINNNKNRCLLLVTVLQPDGKVPFEQWQANELVVGSEPHSPPALRHVSHWELFASHSNMKPLSIASITAS